MEHPRHIQPIQHSLDEIVTLPAAREALSHTAGNSQHLKQAHAPVGYHNDHKPVQLRMDPPSFTLPSQPSLKSLGNTLELRRQNTRKHRSLRFARNPIENSPQYKAYRERQQRDSSAEDQKWPAVLEAAFLNALLWIPNMQRRKYSYHGKPHGRNELIKEYLWLAYVQNLPPGERPDKHMMRTRKQVSSHIQVLKGFMKEHPDFERLFPKKTKDPVNGFQDSYKNDPCLRALTEGRLYTGPSNHSRNQAIDVSHHVKPVVFWLLITSRPVPDPPGRHHTKEDLYRDSYVSHEYSELGSQRHTESIESVSKWRQKFPYLEQIHSRNDLSCDILHMDVSLKLMRSYARGGAELVTRTELSFPGTNFARHQWQTVTSLVKPPELYSEDEEYDPQMQHQNIRAEVVQAIDNETRVKVPFPAKIWAHSFTRLTDIQLACEESRRNEDGALNSSMRAARHFVEQISMYQEVHSSSGPGKPFVRRAVILWTFHKTRQGEAGTATWRILDPHPPRRMCMSPSPHPSHQTSSVMNENFNSWVDSPLPLQTQNMMDPFVQGLATPPATAGLHSPFSAAPYTWTNQNHVIPHDNMSFVSSTTVESADTLVGHDTTANIDSFLSNANVHLNDFDGTSNNWHLPHTESFDRDPVWAYNVPSTTPQLWDPATKNNAWADTAPPKHMSGNWLDGSVKNDEHWQGSPTKQDQSYIEATLEQKLLPWIDHSSGHDNSAKNDFRHESQADAHMEGSLGTTKDVEEHWNTGGGFDYEQMAERLK